MGGFPHLQVRFRFFGRELFSHLGLGFLSLESHQTVGHTQHTCANLCPAENHVNPFLHRRGGSLVSYVSVSELL